MRQLSVRLFLSTLCGFFMLSSCGNRSEKIKTPRSIYMADMFESRAYQAQTNDSFFNAKVGNKRPAGTMSIDAIIPYTLPDTEGGYAQSASIKNPLTSSVQLLSKAKELYTINCAICHGEKLDGNGSLYSSGEGPYLAKPATLIGDVNYETMAEGTMFHSIYYGKNLMGSYASQLTQRQIWSVVRYVKTMQNEKKKK